MRARAPSATALLVALSVVREGEAAGLPPRYGQLAIEALRSGGTLWRAIASLAGAASGRRLLAWIEAAFVPGLGRHHCRRKAWLLRHLAALVRQGKADRLLCVGAGFDAIGQQLAASDPALTVVELDHPSTLALRRKLPSAISGDRLLPALPLRLPADAPLLLGLCSGNKDVVLLEGVIMYFSHRSSLRLLRAMSALAQPPRLVFSALDCVDSQRGGGLARIGVFSRCWLAVQREPFRWRCGRIRMQALLRHHGYRADAVWDGDGFGEYVIAASWNGRRNH